MTARLAAFVLLAALTALGVSPAAARPHRKPAPAPAEAPRNWVEVSFTEGFYAFYVDTLSIGADGRGGVSFTTFTVTLGPPDGEISFGGPARRPRPFGVVQTHHVSCGLRYQIGSRVLRTLPKAGFRLDGGTVFGRPGYLSQRSADIGIVDAACAGQPYQPGAPALRTTAAAWSAAIVRLHPETNPLPPMPVGPPREEAPDWVADPRAEFVEIPGGADVPGAVLFLDVAAGGKRTDTTIVARTLVVLGPDVMRLDNFWSPVALVRAARYDCTGRTMTVLAQAGFTRKGDYGSNGGDFAPRSASESPALAAEIDAVCAYLKGQPPSGERHLGWRAAFDAARARWPAGTPDMPPAPPAPPMITSGGPPGPPRPSVITNPDWIRKPTREDVLAVYPARAARDKVDGRAVISCVVNSAGRLEACSVVSEDPADDGFGEAALKLSRLFRMRPATSDGVPTEGRVVRVPIAFHPAD